MQRLISTCLFISISFFTQITSASVLYAAVGNLGSSLVTVDPATGNETWINGNLGGAINAMAFDPNGILYAAVGNLGSALVTVDLATGNETWINGNLGGAINAMAFDPNGILFAAVGNLGSALVTVDLATGNETWINGNLGGAINAMAFRPESVSVPEPATLALLLPLLAYLGFVQNSARDRRTRTNKLPQ